MINAFGDLLSYSAFSPLILRVALGLFFIYFSIKKFKNTEQASGFFESINFKPGKFFSVVFALLEGVGGLLLVIGLWTQIVVLIFAAILLGTLFIKWRAPEKLPGSIGYYFLLFIIAISLIFTGAGFLAFDLPL